MEKYNYNSILNAYYKYNENMEKDLEKRIYKTFGILLQESKEEIKKILEKDNTEITYDDLINIYDELNDKYEYKKIIKMEKNEEQFINVIYMVPKGIVYVEANDLKELLKEILLGIKYRNGTVIVVKEMNEYDINEILELLIQKSFNAYNLECAIKIIPYEESGKIEAEYKKLRIFEEKDEEKEKEGNVIYLENEDFSKEIRYVNDVDILKGSFDEIINKINEKGYKSAVIYTHSTDLGYKFINRINAENVFMNSSLQNVEKVGNNENKYLMNRQIMFSLI